MPEVLHCCGGDEEEHLLILLRLSPDGGDDAAASGIDESLFTDEYILRAILLSSLQNI